MAIGSAGESLLEDRIVGEYSRHNSGPLVMCLAGVHGNEPAGITALRRVFEILNELAPPFIGTFIGLAGNLSALKNKSRFIDKDLNRCWTDEAIDYVKLTPGRHLKSVEDREQKELLEIINGYSDRAFEDFLFIDLHTTSASGGVFSICSDDKVAKSIAVNLQVPVIIGFEEVLHGTTLNYFKSLNLPAVGFEAGQHDDPDSVENMIAAIFILLNTMGCIAEEHVPGFSLFEIRLGKIAHQLPEILKFRYRYSVGSDEEFEMLPGFSNFQVVEKGQLVAYSNGAEVRVERSGMLLMPLYQKQGEDGFFIVIPMNIDDLP